MILFAFIFSCRQFLHFKALVSDFTNITIPRFPHQVEAIEPCLLEVVENLSIVRQLTHDNLVGFLGIAFINVSRLEYLW